VPEGISVAAALALTGDPTTRQAVNREPGLRRQRAAFAEDLRRQQLSRRRGGGDAQPFMAILCRRWRR
jgi:hypothetical protein